MKKYLLAGVCLFFCVDSVMAADDIELDNTMGTALEMIGALAAHNLGFTGKGITVGIVDTGLDPAHTEFAGRVSPYAKDIITGKSIDYTGEHGVKVAGVIGAAKNNAGMRGVAYNSYLAAVQASSDGKYITDINKAYNYLNPVNSVKIINNSYGDDPLIGESYVDDEAAYKNKLAEKYKKNYQPVIDAMAKHDKVLVYSAGNDRNVQPNERDGMGYAIPEVAKNMLVVVSYNANSPGLSYDDKTTYSNVLMPASTNFCGRAAAYCLAAPGDDIYTTVPKQKYALASGTSIAAPMVTGAVALVYQAFPGMTAAQLTETILQTAVKEKDIWGYEGDLYPFQKYETKSDGTKVFSTHYLSFEEVVGQGYLDVGSAVKGPKHFTGNAGGVYTYNAPKGTVSTFAQDIDGPDGYVQKGKGDVYFTGNSTYAGDTSIGGGGFYVTGSVASNVTASSGAKVGGNGVIGGNLTVKGASVDLTKIGTGEKLTVAGDFVSTNADLFVNVDEAGSSFLSVDGHAVINGGSVVFGEDIDPVSGKQYTILTSGDDIEGKGYASSSVYSLYMFVDAAAKIDGNRVVVNVGDIVNVNELPGLAPNQQKIADTYMKLQENAANVPLTSKLYRYSASSPAVREALSQLSGTVHVNQLASRSAGKMASNMFARIRNVSPETGVPPPVAGYSANEFWDERDFYQVAQYGNGVIYRPRYYYPPEDMAIKAAVSTGKRSGGYWAQPYGGHARVKSDYSAGMASSNTSLYGVQGGADVAVADGNVLIGGALAFGRGNTKQGGAKIDVNDYRIGGYVGADIEKVSLRGSASIGYQEYDGDRNLSLYGVSAKSDYDGYSVDLSLDGDFELFKIDELALKLVFGAEMIHEKTDAFTESGAGALSLKVDGASNTLFNAKVGVGIERRNDDYGIEADLYYRNLLSGYDKSMTARFVGGGDTLKLDGYDYSQHVGGLEVSFYLRMTDNFCFYADATAEISKDTTSVVGSVGFRYNF